MKIIRIMLIIVLFSLISFSTDAKDKICSNKAINHAVQLQDNGWLKIVDQYIEEVTPEDFYTGNEQLIKMHKDMVKKGIERETMRRLHVKIQFLKPCVATTEADEYFKNKDLDATFTVSDEKSNCIDLLFKSYNALQQGNKEKSEEITTKAFEQCPNLMDYMEPCFKCDYRFKVFNTTFTPSKFKKYESSEFSYFPKAPITDMTGKYITRKDKMLPGETMWITFYIPNDATSWCVWVPK